jgi:hypothetical protein
MIQIVDKKINFNKIYKRFFKALGILNIFIYILLMGACSDGELKENTEPDPSASSDVGEIVDAPSENINENVFEALRNKTFSEELKKLDCYYPNGERIQTYDQNSKVTIYLSFNEDSLVYFYWPISDPYKLQSAVYRVREVTKDEDPYWDDQPTHYIAEFYTSFDEIVRLTFSKSLDFENEDILKQDAISISAKFLDYNLVKKIDDEISPKIIPDPFAPDADQKDKELGKQYVSSRVMQCGATCRLTKETIDVDWTNPINWK